MGVNWINLAPGQENKETPWPFNQTHRQIPWFWQSPSMAKHCTCCPHRQPVLHKDASVENAWKLLRHVLGKGSKKHVSPPTRLIYEYDIYIYTYITYWTLYIYISSNIKGVYKFTRYTCNVINWYLLYCQYGGCIFTIFQNRKHTDDWMKTKRQMCGSLNWSC